MRSADAELLVGSVHRLELSHAPSSLNYDADATIIRIEIRVNDDVQTAHNFFTGRIVGKAKQE
jgi:hypothetical protein